MRRIAGIAIVTAAIGGCEEQQGGSTLPDGPFVHGVLRYENGTAREITTPTAEYSNGTCSGEHEAITIELSWPHQQIALGDFDLGDPYRITTSIPKGGGVLSAEWSGWIQFEVIDEAVVEGRYELGPVDDPVEGIVHVDRGAFSCPVGP